MDERLRGISEHRTREENLSEVFAARMTDALTTGNPEAFGYAAFAREEAKQNVHTMKKVEQSIIDAEAIRQQTGCLEPAIGAVVSAGLAAQGELKLN